MISVTIGLTPSVIKQLVINCLQWNKQRADKTSHVYEYILEHGMRNIEKAISDAEEEGELEEIVHDIFDEDLNDFIEAELVALSNNRTAR